MVNVICKHWKFQFGAVAAIDSEQRNLYTRASSIDRQTDRVGDLELLSPRFVGPQCQCGIQSQSEVLFSHFSCHCSRPSRAAPANPTVLCTPVVLLLKGMCGIRSRAGMAWRQSLLIFYVMLFESDISDFVPLISESKRFCCSCGAAAVVAFVTRAYTTYSLYYTNRWLNEFLVQS